MTVEGVTMMGFALERRTPLRVVTDSRSYAYWKGLENELYLLRLPLQCYDAQIVRSGHLVGAESPGCDGTDE